ncbi:MAG TPA: hypothetical protein VIX91_22445 [Candidatus Acidoferrum sp.]
MRALKAICIFFSLLCVVSALTGIRTVHWSTSDGLNLTKQVGLGNTLWSVFNALLYAGAAYGIHRRAPVVWKLGWAILIISFLEFTIRGLSLSLSLPNGWVASVGILIGGIVVTVYWGVWWGREKDYFRVVSPKEQ